MIEIKLCWQTVDLKKNKMLLRHSETFDSEYKAYRYFESLDCKSIVAAWLEIGTNKLRDLK